MGLEKRFIEQDTVLDKVAFVTDDYSMKVYDYVVRVDSTEGALNITLPSVAEAAGRIYSIFFETDGGDVTIQDQDESQDWSDITLTAEDDCALLYSDGMKWWTLSSVTT